MENIRRYDENRFKLLAVTLLEHSATNEAEHLAATNHDTDKEGNRILGAALAYLCFYLCI
jgi:hypothetical protein